MSFDGTGDFLAVGDKAGRVIIFRHSGPLKNSRYFDYKYFAEIQSHEPEFDHLKSIELEEKINYVHFLNYRCPKQNSLGGSLQLLSTNDRIIKLWKVEHKVRR
jgi:serine/threonine-protein phosphatase 2A regulatory subunit B